MAGAKAGQGDLAYVVRFQYPADPVVIIETPPAPIPPPLETLNIAYAVQGAPSVSPLRVFDDGSSTWFDFPTDSTLPVPGPPVSAQRCRTQSDSMPVRVLRKM